MNRSIRLSAVLLTLGLPCLIGVPDIVHAGPYGARTPAPTVQLMAAWTTPVSEDLDLGWEAAPGFGFGMKWWAGPRARMGFEVGYLQQVLDETYWAAGEFDVSGADIDIVPLTLEAEILLAPPRPVTPTVNFGFGLYHISIDDAGVVGPEGRRAMLDYADQDEFGFHIGVGLEFRGRRGGIRIDGAYHLVFMEGDDMSFAPLRAGIFINTGR